MGDVTKLPTASASRVVQPRSIRARRAAIAKAEASGTFARLPVQFLRPEVREAVAKELAIREERQALYSEAGIVRNGPMMLTTTILAALLPEQQENVLDRLVLLQEHSDEAPYLRAALTYAKSILGRDR